MRSLALTLLWVGCALAHPPADLLLTTDRLAYAPNQEIHARALALSSETRAPVEGLEITLTLRGRVGAARFEVRERARTSALGVAHARFSISEEVEGGLRLTASAPEARQSARRLHVTPPAPRDARARSRGAMEGSPRLTLGWLHPPLLDVDNRLVITAQDPGGRPLDLPVEVRVGSAVRRVETGPDGVALIDAPLRTTDDVVEARAGGVEARLEARHAARGEAVALPTRPEARAGGALPVRVRTAEGAGARIRLALDLDGIVDQREIITEGPETRVDYPIPEGLSGVGRLLAVRDARVSEVPVLIRPPGRRLEARLSLTSQGSEARLRLQLRDEAGRPVAGVAEISALPEAVYAHGAQGLTGVEPLFGALSGRAFDALAPAPGPLEGEALWPWLLHQAHGDPPPPLPRAFDAPLGGAWPMQSPPARGAGPPPAWLRALAGVTPAWRAPRRAWRWVAWGLAGLLLAWAWARGPWARRAALLTHAALLIALPLLPWGGSIPEGLSRAYPDLPRSRAPRAPPLHEDPSFAPDTLLTLQVTPSEIRLDGAGVVRLERFALPEGATPPENPFWIEPLSERLQAAVRGMKARARERDQRLEVGLTLILDEEAPYALLTQLMYTAGQAEISAFQLLTPRELLIISPRWPIAPGWLLLFALAALIGLIVARAPKRDYAAWILITLYLGLQIAARATPVLDEATLRLPLGDLLALIGGGLALMLALAWLRRGPSPITASLATLLLLASAPLLPSLRPYLLTPGRRAPMVPTICAAPCSGPSAEGGAVLERASRPAPADVRRWTPDTALYTPALTIDARGEARLSWPLGPRPGAWRVTALAHDARGAMGLARASLEIRSPPQLEGLARTAERPRALEPCPWGAPVERALASISLYRLARQRAPDADTRDEARRGLHRGLLRLLSLIEAEGRGVEPWLMAHALEALTPEAGIDAAATRRRFTRALEAGLLTLPPDQLPSALRAVARASQGARAPLRRAALLALERALPEAPYALALRLGALQDLDLAPRARRALADRLAARATRGARGVHWPAASTRAGSGRGGAVEVTALASLALRREGRARLSNLADEWLLAQRGADGAWSTPWGTSRALEALEADPHLRHAAGRVDGALTLAERCLQAETRALERPATPAALQEPGRGPGLASAPPGWGEAAWIEGPWYTRARRLRRTFKVERASVEARESLRALRLGDGGGGLEAALGARLTRAEVELSWGRPYAQAPLDLEALLGALEAHKAALRACGVGELMPLLGLRSAPRLIQLHVDASGALVEGPMESELERCWRAALEGARWGWGVNRVEIPVTYQSQAKP